MRKFAPLALLALCLTTTDAVAVVGNTYLTAYDKTKGTQASAGRYGTQILLRTKSQAGTTTKGADGRTRTTAAYTEKVTFCNRDYFTTKRGSAWIAAHRRAQHVLVVRYHQAKGKYRSLCGSQPKRAAALKKKAT
jgi:hypothetical protein